MRFYEFQDFFYWIPIIKTSRELSNYVLPMNGNWYCPSAIILTSQYLDLSMTLTTSNYPPPTTPRVTKSPLISAHLRAATWPGVTPTLPRGPMVSVTLGLVTQTTIVRDEESPSHDIISSDMMRHHWVPTKHVSQDTADHCGHWHVTLHVPWGSPVCGNMSGTDVILDVSQPDNDGH